MNRIRTVLLLTLATVGCGGASGDDTGALAGAGSLDSTPTSGDAGTKTGLVRPQTGAGGSEAGTTGGAGGDDQGQAGSAGQGGAASTAGAGGIGSAGTGGSDSAGAGGSGGSDAAGNGGEAGTDTGGAGGSDVGGSDPGGAGGTPSSGGVGGSDVGGSDQGGSDQGGAGGQGGTGGVAGSDQGGTDPGGSAGQGGAQGGAGGNDQGGTGGSSVIPPPVCSDSDAPQCAGLTVQTCVGGQWQDSTVCPYVCSAGACTGECVPDSKACTGSPTGTKTCGEDGFYGAATSCYGGSCTGGACDQNFELVADFSGEDTSGDVIDLALDGAYAYWLTGNSVRRARKDGSAPYEILTAITFPTGVRNTGLIVSNGWVYYATGDGVFEVPTTGGTPGLLADPTGVHAPQSPAPLSLALANGKLYWNDSQVSTEAYLCQDIPLNRPSVVQNCNDHKVVTYYTYDLEASSLSTWQTSQYEYSPVLGVIGSEIVVAQYRYNLGDGNFYSSFQTLDAVTGALSRTLANSVIVDGTNNTFGFFDLGVGFAPDSMVYSTILSGASPFVIGKAPLGVVNPWASNTLIESGYHVAAIDLASDDVNTYYVSGGDAVSVIRIGMDGSNKTTLFTNAKTESTLQMALDDSYVYFSADTATGEKAVLRTAK